MGKNLTPPILTFVSACLLAGSAYAAGPQRIEIDDEDDAALIYAVGALDGNKGVYTLPLSGTYAADKISGSTYIQYNFNGSGGTFVSKETVYGTYDAGFSIYAGKATAAGGADGPWSHVTWNYRNMSDYTNYTYEIVATDMTYDAVGGKIYGWFKADNDGFSYHLCIYDGEAVTVTPVGGTSSIVLNAIAADGSGNLWGVDGASGVLYSISKTDGTPTKVGSLGVSGYSYPNQSAAIDPASGKMYWSALNMMSAYLYEIDLTECTATMVYSFPMGQRFQAFYIPAPEANKDAPAATDDLAAEFIGTGTDVKVSFTAPSLTFGGSSLTGELDYVISVDGEAVAGGSGKVNAGAEASKTLTMTEGLHTVAVHFSNSEGDGPKASVQVYAGFDRPGSVSGISLEADGNQVALSWTAPEGKNGGLVDGSKLTYTVTRNPGNVAVATGTADMAVTDDIPEGPIAEYTYTVTVYYDGVEGESVTSASVLVGTPYTTPYKQDFNDAESLSAIAFKAIDLDPGTNSWELVEDGGNKFVRVVGGNYKSRQDYLYVAPILYYGGVEYTLKFKIANNSSFDNTQLRIFLSKSQSSNSEDFVTPYIENNYNYRPAEDEVGKFTEYEKTFTVAETGVYCLGFYDFGQYYTSNAISIDDIEITGLFPSPVAVSGLKAETAGAGSRDVTITFTTPSLDINGDALTALDKVEIYRGEELLKAVTEDVRTGVGMTYEDKNAPRGILTYTVVTYSGDFASAPATASVKSGYAKNLVLTAVEAPVTVAVDGSETLTAKVFNDGADTAEAYKVLLLCDGEAVEELAGEELPTEAEATFKFTIAWTEKSPESAVYSVRVDYEGDENSDDNVSAEYSVAFGQKEPEGVEAVGADSVRVSVEGKTVVVAGAGDRTVAVYAADGRLVDETANPGARYELGLEAGVYVVSTGSHTCKVIIR